MPKQNFMSLLKFLLHSTILDKGHIQSLNLVYYIILNFDDHTTALGNTAINGKL